MPQLIKLTEKLSVSGQPEPSEMGAIASRGFKVVVCNRPDNESPGQPSMDDMQAATEAAGMKFVRYPVTPATFPGSDLAGLGQVFDGSDNVYAYCRTGTRSANLWVASRSAAEKAAAAESARAYGVDLSLADRLS